MISAKNLTREEEIQKAKNEAFPIPEDGREYGCACGAAGFELGAHWADNHPINNDRLRYCIEYINPKFPFLDNGELNIRHLRVPDSHWAEMNLTLILSFGGKIVSLYRGNVIQGRVADWTPTPDIIEEEDWISEEWINELKTKAER